MPEPLVKLVSSPVEQRQLNLLVYVYRCPVSQITRNCSSGLNHTRKSEFTLYLIIADI